MILPSRARRAALASLLSTLLITALAAPPASALGGRGAPPSRTSVLAPLPDAAGEESLRRVGIYPLERLGPADPAYDKLQLYLRKNLGLFPDTEAFDLATPSTCKADDLQCLVAVGRLAAADLVVHGSVERFGEGYAVRLQLIDVSRTTRREVKRLIQGGGADLVAAMELAACELLTSEKCQGTLRVSGPAGAHVLVGAREVGEVPYEGPLPVGRHSVRVAKGGLSTEDRWVSVSFKQDVPLHVEERPGLLSFVDQDFEAPLLPPPEAPAAAPAPSGPAIALVAPPAPPSEPERPESAKWLPTAFYGSLAAGGACLLGGLTFGLLAQSNASEANEKFEQRRLTPADKALYDAARSDAAVANVLYGVSTLGLAAAAVFYLIDPDAIRLAHGAGGDVSFSVTPGGVGAAGSF